MATVPASPGVVKGQVARPGAPLPPSAPAKVITEAMRAHYRDRVNDSKIDYSPAWDNARITIRHLNYLSPLMLGVLLAPDAPADGARRKESLTFLSSATDALAKVVSEQVIPSKEVSKYDRIELDSTLTHLIGRLWLNSKGEDQINRVDDLVKTVTELYTDKAFAQAECERAKLMQEASGYLKVDSPETMETRLRNSMYLQTMSFFEAVKHDRVGNGKGAYFTYGKKPHEVMTLMRDSFDGMMSRVIARHQFEPVLSNDQRTSIMQSWLRNAGDIYRAEYVTQTESLMNWFRAGPESSFPERYAHAKGQLQQILDSVAAATEETMAELICVAEGRYADEQSEKAASRPAVR